MKLMIIDSDPRRIGDIRRAFDPYCSEICVYFSPGNTPTGKSKILHSYVRKDPDFVIVGDVIVGDPAMGGVTYTPARLSDEIRCEQKTMPNAKVAHHFDVCVVNGNSRNWEDLAGRWMKTYMTSKGITILPGRSNLAVGVGQA
jgi:hypothetical protein